MSSRLRKLTLSMLLILAIGFSGCSQPAPATPAATATQVVAPATPAATPVATKASFPRTLVDNADRKVTFDKQPERIVSLSAASTESLYALGLQDKVVGVDDYSDYPAEAKQKEKVGGFSKPNFEKIVNLAPDLILATDLHTKTVVPELENRGFKVIVFKPETISDVPANIRMLADLCGATAKGEALTKDFESRLEAVKTKMKDVKERPRIFFEIDPKLITVGPGTFIDDMITLAGGANIAADAKTAWPTMSPEAIVLKNPQLIILSDHGSDAGGVTPEMVKARPGWDETDAVKNNRIVELADRDLTDRPGPRAIEGLEYLARIIHPELFK